MIKYGFGDDQSGQRSAGAQPPRSTSDPDDWTYARASTYSSLSTATSVRRAVGGTAGVVTFLGVVPGGHWAHSYYSALGSSAIVADLSWQELVAPGLVFTIGLVAGALFAYLSARFLRVWSCVTPWRLRSAAHLPSLPGALIFPLILVAIALALGSLFKTTPSGLLSTTIFSLILLSLGIAWLVFAFMALFTTVGGSRPFMDPLVSMVVDAVYVSRAPTAMERRMMKGARAITTRRYGIALALLVGCSISLMFGILVFGLLTNIFLTVSQMSVGYATSIAACASIAMMAWVGRLTYFMVRHGRPERAYDRHVDRIRVPRRLHGGRGPAEQGITLESLARIVEESEEQRYDLSREWMLDSLEEAISRNGSSYLVARVMQTGVPRIIFWPALVLAGIAMLGVMQFYAGWLGSEQADELRTAIIQSADDECNGDRDGSESRYAPFGMLSIGTAEPTKLVIGPPATIQSGATPLTADAGIGEPQLEQPFVECRWVLASSSSRIWTATADDAGSLLIAPVPIDSIVAMSSG